MFSWLKSLFGKRSNIEAGSVVNVINTVAENDDVTNARLTAKVSKAKKAAVTKTKKTTKKTVDLSAMTKTQLLALAKERGVKANASLNKAELLKRLG